VGEKGATPNLDGGDLRVAIVVSRFNEDVTKRLLRGAQEALQKHGVPESEIDVYWVPGSLELPVTTLALAEKGEHDAIVALGAVIRGETFHFEIVAMQAAQGLMQVQLDTGVPVAFGVLTTEDVDQALARSGLKNNKGADAAEAAIETANLLREIQG
jgi:6,7-dimethyl-8-ribityllumazine synthase